MGIFLKIVSFAVSFCFLFNATTGDIAFSQNLLFHPGHKLATTSIFNKLAKREFKETENLKMVLKAHLLQIAQGKKEIRIGDLIKYARNNYHNSIFDRTHVYFSEKQTLPRGLNLPQGYHGLMCRICNEDKTETRTYYGVFSLTKDSDDGFDIEVFTDKEWKNLKNLACRLTTLPQRALERPEDAETQRRYSELGENVVDRFIREHIGTKEKPGNFVEFSGRAEKLDWDTRFPDRITPAQYYKPANQHFYEFILRNVNMPLQRINSGFKFETVFKDKNIVLIPLGENEGFPVIEEKDPVTGEIRKVPVTSHTSKNAVYFFVKQAVLDKIMQDSDRYNPWDDYEISLFFRKRIIHETGENYGLPVIEVTENDEILNDLDIIYKDIVDMSYLQKIQNDIYGKKFRKLQSLTEKDLVDLDHLRWKSPLAAGEDVERDYASGNFEKIDTKTWSILEKLRDITKRDDLKLVFAYVIDSKGKESFSESECRQKWRFRDIFGEEVTIPMVRDAFTETGLGREFVKLKRAELKDIEKQIEDEISREIVKRFRDLTGRNVLDLVFNRIIPDTAKPRFTREEELSRLCFEFIFGEEITICRVRDALTKTDLGREVINLKRIEFKNLEREVRNRSARKIIKKFRDVTDGSLGIVFDNVIGDKDKDQFFPTETASQGYFRLTFGRKVTIPEVRYALTETDLGREVTSLKRVEFEIIKKRMKDQTFQEIIANFRDVTGKDDIELVFEHVINDKKKSQFFYGEDFQEIRFNHIFEGVSLDIVRHALTETDLGKEVVRLKRIELGNIKERVSAGVSREIIKKFRDIVDKDDLEFLLDDIVKNEYKTEFSISEHLQENRFIHIFGEKMTISKVREALTQTELGRALIKLKATGLQRLKKTLDQVEESDVKTHKIYKTFCAVDDKALLKTVLDIIDSGKIDSGTVDQYSFEFLRAFGSQEPADIQKALGTEEGKQLLDVKRLELESYQKNKNEKRQRKIRRTFRVVNDMKLLEIVFGFIDSKQVEANFENMSRLLDAFDSRKSTDIQKAFGAGEGKQLLAVKRLELTLHQSFQIRSEEEEKLQNIYQTFCAVDDKALLKTMFGIIDSGKIDNDTVEKYQPEFLRAFGSQDPDDIKRVLETEEGKLLLKLKHAEIRQYEDDKIKKQLETERRNFRKIDDMDFLKTMMPAMIPGETDYSSEPNHRFSELKKALKTEEGEQLITVKQEELKQSKERGTGKLLQGIRDTFRNIEDTALLGDAINVVDNNVNTDIEMLLRAFGSNKMTDIQKAFAAEQGELLLKVKRAELEARINKEKREKDFDQKNNAKIKRYKKLAREVVTKIAPPVCRYALFTYQNMYEGREFQNDESALASRFKLFKIGTGRKEGLSRSILGRMTKFRYKPENVIVQLPPEMADASVLAKIEQKAPGIKFLIIDTQGMRGITDKTERKEYRRNIYSMMYLARNINKKTRKRSKLYISLRILIKAHFPVMHDKDAIDTEIDRCMKALMDNDLVQIIKYILSFKPSREIDKSGIKAFAKTLMSA